MGYFPSNPTDGIHMRLYSRAFIFDDGLNKPVVYVSIDMCFMDNLIKKHVWQLCGYMGG